MSLTYSWRREGSNRQPKEHDFGRYRLHTHGSPVWLQHALPFAKLIIAACEQVSVLLQLTRSSKLCSGVRLVALRVEAQVLSEATGEVPEVCTEGEVMTSASIDDMSFEPLALPTESPPGLRLPTYT